MVNIMTHLEMLEELHRQREAHERQLAASTIAGTVSAAGFLITIFALQLEGGGSDSTRKSLARSLCEVEWFTKSGGSITWYFLVCAAVLLAGGSMSYWKWHAGRMRAIDCKIQCVYEQIMAEPAIRAMHATESMAIPPEKKGGMKYIACGMAFLIAAALLFLRLVLP